MNLFKIKSKDRDREDYSQRQDTNAEAVYIYKEKLVFLAVPLIYEGLRSIFKVAVKNCKKRKKEHEIYKEFQILLKNIQEWSETTLKNATDAIINKAPTFPGLMTAIFVGEAKILSNLKITRNSKKIKFEIPTVSRFIHKIYIHSAHKIFYNPKLFQVNAESDALPQLRENNIEKIKNILKDTIYHTFYDMLPIKNILHDNIGEYFEEDEESSSDDDEEPEPENKENSDEGGGEESQSDDEDDLSDDDDDDDDEDQEQVPENKQQQQQRQNELPKLRPNFFGNIPRQSSLPPPPPSFNNNNNQPSSTFLPSFSFS